MKKLFSLLFVSVLVGAGCFGGQLGGGGQNNANTVSGDWWLTFDLPEGWAIYADYDEDNPSPETGMITRDLSDVVLQSTNLPIILEGDQPGEAVLEFVESDYSYVRVFRFDPRTRVPTDAEDLGNGFFKLVDEDGDATYYFVGENGKYKFLVTQEDRELSDVEAVILTAQEVTIEEAE